MPIVYIATNVFNGKRYIGFTGKDLAHRKRAHHARASKFAKDKSNSIFHHAIRKHGRENFVWEILAEFSTNEEALSAEISFISKLKPEYNILPSGGGGASGVPAHNRTSVLCLETGALFPSIWSASLFYGMHEADIRKSCKMLGHSSKGFHFIKTSEIISGKDRILILESLHEKLINNRRRKLNLCSNKENVDNSKYASRSKKVICLDDGLEFSSASEAARHYKSVKSAIIELCLEKNGRKTVNGKRFAYVNEASHG